MILFPGSAGSVSKSRSCCCEVISVVSDFVQPHRLQPTRLPCPWDSPGKNTGVGCRFLLQCMKEKSESEFAQSCPTLSDPMACSPPGSSVHGTFQARVLEWGATGSRGSDKSSGGGGSGDGSGSRSEGGLCGSCSGGRFRTAAQRGTPCSRCAASLAVDGQWPPQMIRFCCSTVPTPLLPISWVKFPLFKKPRVVFASPTKLMLGF